MAGRACSWPDPILGRQSAVSVQGREGEGGEAEAHLYSPKVPSSSFIGWISGSAWASSFSLTKNFKMTFLSIAPVLPYAKFLRVRSEIYAVENTSTQPYRLYNINPIRKAMSNIMTARLGSCIISSGRIQVPSPSACWL